jgi:3-hydroxybutyryl-CoA dehydrogenase
VVFETTEALSAAGRARIVTSLERGVSAGKITERERDRALAGLSFTTTLTDLADRQLVIEAIVEDEKIKASVFAQLDDILTDPDAVLATNTSSIPVMKLGAATKNPGRVLGLHFFNPVPVLPLVELVTTLATSDAAAARAEQFAGTVLGKQVVRCADRSGFVVNALLVPYLLSAIRMVESGSATAAVRSDRPGHPQADRRQDVRGVQRAAFRAAPTAAAHGGGRSAGQEVRARLLHLLTTATGRLPRLTMTGAVSHRRRV